MLSLPTTALARALPTAELEALHGGKVPAMHLDVFVPVIPDEHRELVAALAMRATDLSALAASLEALAVAVATPAPAPVVHVHVPEQLAPVVNVPEPRVVMQESPQQAPQVQVDVHVPQSAPPVVEVTTPEPVVNVTVEPIPPRRIEFERDQRGNISAAEEVE